MTRKSSMQNTASNCPLDSTDRRSIRRRFHGSDDPTNSVVAWRTMVSQPDQSH